MPQIGDKVKLTSGDRGRSVDITCVIRGYDPITERHWLVAEDGRNLTVTLEDRRSYGSDAFLAGIVVHMCDDESVRTGDHYQTVWE